MTMKIFLAHLIVFISIVAFCSGERALLDDAWMKYEYRDFDSAWRNFQRVERETKDKDLNLHCEALTGLAFCLQFGKMVNAGVGDYEGAVGYYHKCIELKGDDARLVPFWKSMMAECMYRVYSLNGNKDYYHQAMEIWSELDGSQPDSLVAQDSLLFRTVVPTRDFHDPGTDKKIARMEEYIEPILDNIRETGDAGDYAGTEKAVLAGAMANYLGALYANRHEFKKATEYYETYAILGPTSHHYKLNAFYSIARISDAELGDMDRAIRYYTRIFTESPAYTKSYFSMQRVEALKKLREKHGKESSKEAP
ncbi:MAG: tetratricopeptide repeat protein [Victivallales bacterium]|nr:tetratricopeptide repeat protein [Victivallales bacterium]